MGISKPGSYPQGGGTGRLRQHKPRKGIAGGRQEDSLGFRV